jgi:hypothetical protein
VRGLLRNAEHHIVCELLKSVDSTVKIDFDDL